MAANNVGLPAGVSKEQAYGMAETEMEYRVELFNRLLNTCFNKCIDKRHKEAELNMGENSCVDRCVSKYWAVNGIIGQMLSAGQRPMWNLYQLGFEICSSQIDGMRKGTKNSHIVVIIL